VSGNVTEKVDLYTSAYANYELDAYRQTRIETYGEDLGQTSWVTPAEADAIPRLLDLSSDSSVLEIGCGSGRYALRLAEKIGCRVLGLDINTNGIGNANELASQKNLESLVRFEVCDASRPLPFAEGDFDAVFSNDALCHIPGRAALFARIHRVLKPGGRLLFSDALIIGGVISQQEIAARSSIGYYLFSPPAENERLLENAGFRIISAQDTTGSAADISMRWHEARRKHAQEMTEAEGAEGFAGLQQFLLSVHNLTADRRLLRILYLARKEQ
jgi:SAM-dependent methyltransferase